REDILVPLDLECGDAGRLAGVDIDHHLDLPPLLHRPGLDLGFTIAAAEVEELEPELIAAEGDLVVLAFVLEEAEGAGGEGEGERDPTAARLRDDRVAQEEVDEDGVALEADGGDVV